MPNIGTHFQGLERAIKLTIENPEVVHGKEALHKRIIMKKNDAIKYDIQLLQRDIIMNNFVVGFYTA